MISSQACATAGPRSSRSAAGDASSLPVFALAVFDDSNVDSSSFRMAVKRSKSWTRGASAWPVRIDLASSFTAAMLFSSTSASPASRPSSMASFGMSKVASSPSLAVLARASWSFASAASFFSYFSASLPSAFSISPCASDSPPPAPAASSLAISGAATFGSRAVSGSSYNTPLPTPRTSTASPANTAAATPSASASKSTSCSRPFDSPLGPLPPGSPVTGAVSWPSTLSAPSLGLASRAARAPTGICWMMCPASWASTSSFSSLPGATLISLPSTAAPTFPCSARLGSVLKSTWDRSIPVERNSFETSFAFKCRIALSRDRERGTGPSSVRSATSDASPWRPNRQAAPASLPSPPAGLSSPGRRSSVACSLPGRSASFWGAPLLSAEYSFISSSRVLHGLGRLRQEEVCPACDTRQPPSARGASDSPTRRRPWPTRPRATPPP